MSPSITCSSMFQCFLPSSSPSHSSSSSYYITSYFSFASSSSSFASTPSFSSFLLLPFHSMLQTLFIITPLSFPTLFLCSMPVPPFSFNPLSPHSHSSQNSSHYLSAPPTLTLLFHFFLIFPFFVLIVSFPPPLCSSVHYASLIYPSLFSSPPLFQLLSLSFTFSPQQFYSSLPL